MECINSCLQQNYPAHLLEIIIVDDQSEDNTYDLVEAIHDPRVVLMRLGVYRKTTIKGSKKKAIAYGINHAKGSIILTTDADCIVPKDWVLEMLHYFNNPEVQLVSGPVKIIETGGWLAKLQTLDFTGNGLVNAAGIFSRKFYLANAANLAYRKDVFINGEAYDDNYHIASGDDIFLLQQINKTYPKGIVFAKSKAAIVSTHAVLSWNEFLQQRLRWAGKMNLVNDNFLRFIPVFIWLQRISIFVMFLTGMILNDIIWITSSFICLILQWLIDFILQMDACKFYNVRKWEWWFIPIEIMHSFYFVLLGIFCWLPITIDWKGRKV
jgi:cellulose synthase/poly-beta-1,6-N-acetylglucosamine synthase-like glycosyltransferase